MWLTELKSYRLCDFLIYSPVLSLESTLCHALSPTAEIIVNIIVQSMLISKYMLEIFTHKYLCKNMQIKSYMHKNNKRLKRHERKPIG